MKAQSIQGLYAITAPELITPEQLIFSVEQAILGGTRILQYRNKHASESEKLQQAALSRASGLFYYQR